MPGMADRKDGDKDSRDGQKTTMYTRILDRTIEISEAIVYVGIAIMLAITAIALLVLAVRNVLPLFGDDASNVALDVLDTLLLVFIVVELLFAVRATISQRELLAEPFLLAGIIASIKEIIVLSVKAAETVGQGSAFRDQLWEVGTLGVLVLLLAVAAFLLRRKEREPDEGDKQEKV